jgi:hypothetical protein
MDLVIKTLVIIGTITFIAIVLALPTMLLWNWVVPPVFDLPPINFWQALGINLLSGILFRSSNTNSND